MPFKPIFRAATEKGFHYFSARGVEKVFDLDSADINLLGEVGFDFTDASLIAALAGRGDITINLNSRGGDYYQGLAIYNVLKQHPGKVKINVYGIAASAASLILMAGDERVIAPLAQVMIHNATVFVSGNKQYLAKILERMVEIDGKMVTLYAESTGLTPEKIAEMMDAETFINSADALEMGFITSIMSDNHKDDVLPAQDFSAVLSIANEIKSFLK